MIYLAARIFGQSLRSNTEDDASKSSLRFLLSALAALKVHAPLAESYLIQLDLEGVGLTAMEGKVPCYSSVESKMVSTPIHPPLGPSME